MARRPPDPKVAKARRQKKIVIGASLALVLLLAVQVPKTLKMLNPKTTAAPPPALTAPSATTPTPAPPPTSTDDGAAAPVASSTGLDDTETAPVADQGQLIAFERFAAKDPFSQQVSLSGGATDTSGGTTDLDTLPATPGDTPGVAPAEIGDTGGPGTTTGTDAETGFTTDTGATTTEAPVATSTTVSVNGEAEAVATGDDFPAAGPLFTLAKLAKDGKSVEIGVAGGKLATGGATVTLTRGKPLTLMNTADGTRYTLVLLTVQGF